MANHISWAMWIRLTLACAMICGGLAAPVRTWSQPPIPTLNAGENPSSGLPAAAVPIESRPVVVRGPCDPDYSIISTRCCKDQVESCQPCDYRIYRVDGSPCARASNLDELYASLQPGVPVCFMAHGSYVEWDSMLQDCAGTYRWLRAAAPEQPIHIIFFTWPSDDTCHLLPAIGLNRLGRRASLNGLYLAELIARVPQGHPISLIGHSHGGRMVSATVHALAGGEVEGRRYTGVPDPGHRLRVVLAAAAIDHDWLNRGARFDRVLCRAEAVLNLRNRHDFPLIIYPTRRPFSKQAIAITGVTCGDRRQMGEHACRIDDHDVTDIVGLGHLWTHYYNQPDIASAIQSFIYFNE